MDWKKNLHFIVDLLYLFGHFKRKGICTKTLISINQDAISRNFIVDGNVVELQVLGQGLGVEFTFAW